MRPRSIRLAHSAAFDAWCSRVIADLSMSHAVTTRRQP